MPVKSIQGADLKPCREQAGPARVIEMVVRPASQVVVGCVIAAPEGVIPAVELLEVVSGIKVVVLHNKDDIESVSLRHLHAFFHSIHQVYFIGRWFVVYEIGGVRLYCHSGKLMLAEVK